MAVKPIGRVLLCMLAAFSAATPAKAQCDVPPPQPHAPSARGQPPPPPPPFIDPFFVFFAPGSASLTPQTQSILSNVVGGYHQDLATGVAIAAHADRLGDADFNLRLSERRAAAVADYLRSRIPALHVDIRACGESRPIIETPDGVEEPQNRRAEIVFLPIPR
jgi:outer membrane protein OmpA-like peptidoglycan-associated protein